MPTTRRRRIVKRAVMALALVVLLPVSYIGSAMLICFGQSAGVIPGVGQDVARVVYAPLEHYAAADLPGTKSLQDFAKLARDAGANYRN